MRTLVLSLLSLVLLSILVEEVDARGRWRLFGRRRCRTTQYTQYTYTVTPNVGSYAFSGGPAEVAQQKANLMASRGYWFHPGGSFGGASYEGVGSGMTAQAALNNCCYRGYRRVAGEGVAQGANGVWYACTLYW